MLKISTEFSEIVSQIFGNFDLFLSVLVCAAGSKKSEKRWVTLWKNIGNLDADVLYQNQIFEFFPKSWCLKLDLKKSYRNSFSSQAIK